MGCGVGCILLYLQNTVCVHKVRVWAQWYFQVFVTGMNMTSPLIWCSTYNTTIFIYNAHQHPQTTHNKEHWGFYGWKLNLSVAVVCWFFYPLTLTSCHWNHKSRKVFVHTYDLCTSFQVQTAQISIKYNITRTTSHTNFTIYSLHSIVHQQLSNVTTQPWIRRFHKHQHLWVNTQPSFWSMVMCLMSIWWLVVVECTTSY